MTRAVGPTSTLAPAGDAGAPVLAETGARRRAFEAALQVETLLVKQLVQSAHALGRAEGGYAAMALDALAAGIGRGGGVGIAKKIEAMLARAKDVSQVR